MVFLGEFGFHLISAHKKSFHHFWWSDVTTTKLKLFLENFIWDYFSAISVSISFHFGTFMDLSSKYSKAANLINTKQNKGCPVVSITQIIVQRKTTVSTLSLQISKVSLVAEATGLIHLHSTVWTFFVKSTSEKMRGDSIQNQPRQLTLKLSLGRLHQMRHLVKDGFFWYFESRLRYWKLYLYRFTIYDSLIFSERLITKHLPYCYPNHSVAQLCNFWFPPKS